MEVVVGAGKTSTAKQKKTERGWTKGRVFFFFTALLLLLAFTKIKKKKPFTKPSNTTKDKKNAQKAKQQTTMSPRPRRLSPAKTVYALPERLSRSSAAAIAAEAAAGRIAAMSMSTSASVSSFSPEEVPSAVDSSCFETMSLEKPQCPQQQADANEA